MGTFMSKHCSPMSYGTPLEKKGSPLDQGFQDDAKKTSSIVESNQSKLEAYKDRAKRTKLSKKVTDSIYKANKGVEKIIYLPNKGVYFDTEDGVLINPPDKRYLDFKIK